MIVYVQEISLEGRWNYKSTYKLIQQTLRGDYTLQGKNIVCTQKWPQFTFPAKILVVPLQAKPEFLFVILETTNIFEQELY